MEVLTANKVGALFVFFCTSFLGVFLPFFIPVRPIVLKFGLLFASGLFLALAFLHMSADAIGAFDELYTGEYPAGFVLIPLGFYLTWLADLVAQGIWKKRSGSGSSASGPDPESLKDSGLSKRANCCRSDRDLLGADHKCSNPSCPCTSESSCQCSEMVYPEEAGPTVTGALVSLGGNKKREGLPLLDVILLLIGLCFHAFFEGLAVGLAGTVQNVWQMTASIAINEVFEGAALGTTLRAQDAERHVFNFFLYALGASIVAPTGLVVGIVLETTTTPQAAEWAQGVGLGLAAGVFICIATRHLIAKAMVPEGLNEPLWMPFLKFLVSGLGFALNALLTMIPEEVKSEALAPAAP